MSVHSASVSATSSEAQFNIKVAIAQTCFKLGPLCCVGVYTCMSFTAIVMHQSMLSPRVGGPGIPGGFDILLTSFDKFPTPGTTRFVKLVIHLLYFILCGQPFCVKNASHGKGYFVKSPGYAWPPYPGA